MSLHLLVGAGAVGTATTRHLLALGHQVRIVTRSGNGPEHDDVELVAADAADGRRLAELAADAASIINAANPPYHRWATDGPPLATSMLDAAEAADARLVTMSNLYGYAVGSSPMAAGDPLDPPTAKGRIRTEMWREALARHQAGRVQATEVRASDFVGPGLGDSAHLGERFVRAVLGGRTPRVVGRPDVPHSWTFIDDVGATLATTATDPRAPGRAWHVPTLEPRTAQQMADGIARAAGVDPVAVSRLPRPVLRAVGWFSPTVREVLDVVYQFDAPFVIDDEDTRRVFGLAPTPLDEQLGAMAGTLPVGV